MVFDPSIVCYVETLWTLKIDMAKVMHMFLCLKVTQELVKAIV